MKKIMVFMLLFVFLVGAGVPVQAKAALSVDGNTFDFDKDKNAFVNFTTEEYYELPSQAISYLEQDYNFVITFSSTNKEIRVYLFESGYDIGIREEITYQQPFIFALLDGSVSQCNVYCLNYKISNNDLVLNSEIDNLSSSTNGYYTGSYGSPMYVDSILSSSNILELIVDYNIGQHVSNGNIYHESDYHYLFDNWCTDAGLNCAASSLESTTVIPFWYEPANYSYIVKKNLSGSSSSGIYQLAMIQKKSGHYPYYFTVNDVGYLGVSGTFNSTFTIRTFYYDDNGDGWKLIQRYDVSDLPFDNSNFIFTDNEVFIFSDTDIYNDRLGSSTWQNASSKYYNVDIPEPEITRVPVGGGSTVGGNAKPGGMLDFLVTLATLVWTELFAVEVSVDGYNISFQSIIIWGSVAGFLIFLGSRLFFGKKG